VEGSSFWNHVWAALSREFGDLSAVEPTVQILVRMAAALLFGGALGWQREHVGKAAGLRTHMLVCLGAALFVAVPHLAGMTGDGVSRIIQGLTAGIGFVGAGAILKTQSPAQIHGLTTAAGIWFTAAIGVAVGLGRCATAGLATALAFLVLWLLPVVEHHHDAEYQNAPDSATAKRPGKK